MIRELLNIFGMNIMMAEDANEPSLRIRPRHRIRKESDHKESRDTDEAFFPDAGCAVKRCRNH